MHVVVVESPAKAKTINKYLGSGYQVLASFGHVRDLPSKDGSVKPDEGFAFEWQVDGRGEQRLKEIAQAVKAGDELILATDPDREGEAISWHIVEELKRRKALGHKPIKRVVFNEVTKNAVLDAMRHPRNLDQELIDAYLAPMYGIESLYAADAQLFASVLLLALGLGLISGLEPARQATRVDPVEVLREA